MKSNYVKWCCQNMGTLEPRRMCVVSSLRLCPLLMHLQIVCKYFIEAIESQKCVRLPHPIERLLTHPPTGLAGFGNARTAARNVNIDTLYLLDSYLNRRKRLWTRQRRQTRSVWKNSLKLRYERTLPLCHCLPISFSIIRPASQARYKLNARHV